MASYSYVILGDPIAWSRATPSYSQRYMYDSQKALKAIIADKLSEQHADYAKVMKEQGKDPLFSGPLEIHATYYFPVAQHLNIKKAEALYGKPYIQKPDVDNCSKFLYDTATGILFKDDKIIYKSICQKLYDKNPRTEFTVITEIE